MKRRTIITSILVIVLCLGLISGSTFALFTSEDSVNIAITSGKVNVVATIDPTSLKVYSATTDPVNSAGEAGTLDGTFAGTYYYDKLDGTTFKNGGTVELTDTKTLKINKITPGDKVEVTVSVENNSNVKTKYRIRVNVLDGETLEDQAKSLKLFEGLTVNVGTNDAEPRTATKLNGVIRVSDWYDLAERGDNNNLADVPVEILLPLKAGNEYQDLKTEIQITVEAVQGNANTSELAAINAILTGSATKTNKTMYEAVNEVKEALNITYAEAVQKVTPYVWSVENDLFYGVEDTELEFEYKYFKVYDEMPTAQSFSIYAGSAWTATSVAGLTVGFDAGETTGITSVTYNRSTAEYGQDVVIRTNSAGTTLTINAPKDVVKHYGVAGTLSIVAVAGSSYHEYGKVAFVEIANGRLALESESEVTQIHLSATAGNFNDITIAKDTSIDMPVFSRDSVDIPAEGKLVVALQEGTSDPESDKDYVWLTAFGIYEQVTVSDSDESAGNDYAATSAGVTAEKKETAKQIANNITFSSDSVDYKVTATTTDNGATWTYEVKEVSTGYTSVEYTAASTETAIVVTDVSTSVPVETTKENGLTAQEKETAKQTQVEKFVVAVNDTTGKKYYDLKSALEEIKDRESVTIIKDVEVDSMIVVRHDAGVSTSNPDGAGFKMSLNINSGVTLSFSGKGQIVFDVTHHACEISVNGGNITSITDIPMFKSGYNYIETISIYHPGELNKQKNEVIQANELTVTGGKFSDCKVKFNSGNYNTQISNVVDSEYSIINGGTYVTKPEGISVKTGYTLSENSTTHLWEVVQDIPANAIFKLIPESDPENVAYISASQLNGENGKLVTDYKSGHYTLELMKDVTFYIDGSPSNFWGYKFAIGNGAENVIVDLKGYTFTFGTSSYYGGSYLIAYDCANLKFQNGTIKVNNNIGVYGLFYSYGSHGVAMENVTLINVTNNRNW